MSRTVYCIRLKKEAAGLDFMPYPGPLGERIYAEVSEEAWSQWVGHQIRLINEYRLNLANEEAEAFLEKEMEKFFFGEGSALPPGYVPL